MVDETGKGAIGGAVLGGLLAGPFGAIFGAQLGGSFGANARAKREVSERYERMGVTPAMLEAAQRVAAELADAEEGLRVVKAARDSQGSLVATLNRGIDEAYAAAESSLKAGDEARARERLVERKQLQAKRGAAAAEVAAAEDRVETMTASVRMLQTQAAEIEAELSKVVASSTGPAARSAASPVTKLSEFEDEDPLLRRFRELEGK